MLSKFLMANQKEVLAMTERKSLELAGARPSSNQLREGLPIFYSQLMTVLLMQSRLDGPKGSKRNRGDMEKAAGESNESAMAVASGYPGEVALAKTAGIHGTELERLGYTLSHVVHAYGAMCQAITELATEQNFPITASEFHDLNRCLDVAIAGAVTEYQDRRNTQDMNREVEHVGFLAHELRNALASVSISIESIKRGTVGFGGSTGKVLERGLVRMDELINRSLTEVRLRVDPKINIETERLLHIVDQIVVTAEVEARAKKQIINIQIDPDLIIETDQQLFYSALSNLMQNALKFSHVGATIQVRGSLVGEMIEVEVEDECGGLPANSVLDLFKPFAQENRDKTGLGLGLTIAQRAVMLSQGTIEARNLPGKGCIFKISLPKKFINTDLKETLSASEADE
jgi:signal transduction histidine kinase